MKNQFKEELPSDLAYKELQPNEKPSRKIPYLKIILSVFIFVILCLLIFLGISKILQLKNSESANKLDSEIQAKLKAYPKPLPNTCGEEIKMCPGGNVIEKSGLKCNFGSCPEASSDMTKFWKAENSDEKYKRIYENLDLRYKFSILKNWNFKGLDYGFIIYSPNYNCTEKVVSNTSCDGTILEMISSNTTGESDIEKWYKSDKNYFLINSDNPPKGYKVTQIAEQKAIKVDSIRNNISYYFLHDNTVFVIKMVSASDIDYKNSVPILNDLATSFQFTNK